MGEWIDMKRHNRDCQIWKEKPAAKNKHYEKMNGGELEQINTKMISLKLFYVIRSIF